MTSTAPPAPRGTRPRNRRAQIRAAATTLFYERGYEQVSIADVAESVNVAPSALYRHFTGKSALLYEAIDVTVTAFGDLVEELPSRDLDGIAATCARIALDHRPLGVLWQREARNLPADQHSALRLRLREAIGSLAGTLRTIRPELDPDQAAFLAACGVNAMCSISFHRLTLPEDRFAAVLGDLALRVLAFEFTDGDDTGPAVVPARTLPTTRRDQIAEAAAPLFAAHGFDAVGIDDIGAAVGIAGPSIYNHFASKQEVLFVSLRRGHAVLTDALAAALGSARTSTEALRAVSDSYVALTCDHGHLVANLIAEARNLGPEHQDQARRAQLDYVDQWVDLMQAIRPAEDPVESRLKVQAAQMMANSVATTGFLRHRPRFRQDLAAICWLLQQ